MKKGRHRRFEEARAMKRSHDVDFDALFESLNTGDAPAETRGEDDDTPHVRSSTTTRTTTRTD